MTKQTRIEMPKVYEAFINDSEGIYELRKFFWSEKSARKCIKEAFEENEYSRYEYEWGVQELDIER